MAGNSETIEIKIKTMDSQTYTLQVDKQMPVPALKERIASVTGVVTQNQRLICRGKVLKDDQLLSAYHVEDGHTLHLVVREPAASSSEGLPVDSAFNRSSSSNRGQLFQVAPDILVETFNMPGQGERGLADVSRIISAVLGSRITNTGSGREVRDQVGDRHEEAPNTGSAADTTQISHDQSGVRSSNDRSRLQNAFGIPTGVSLGSVQAPVITDAITTLSQYLSHMRQEFSNSGNVGENNNGTSSIQGSEGASSFVAQSENTLPTPASLAELLCTTRQLLNQITEECLLQLARQLENQENLTDSVSRANAQSNALRTGVLLQNLGSYFLELGRTVTTLRFGRSPSEAVVNAGPAVFISPSGPNPLMVQPLPFQPGASFGTPLAGTTQSGSGLTNGVGAGFVPRRIDIQIRRVTPSNHQTEPSGSLESSGQRQPSPTVIGVMANSQPAAGISDAPSSNNGTGVRVLPFRTMMSAVPDPNGSSSEPGSLGFLYPLLGRFPNVASGSLSRRTDSQTPADLRSSGPTALQQSVRDSAGNGIQTGEDPVSRSEERESVSTRTIDVNILSSQGTPSDLTAEGQMPPGILQLLRGLFPGGEFQVERVSSEGTATEATEQAPPSAAAATEEAEVRVTEEGLFLSRMLQHIMPLISQDPGTEHEHPREGDDATTSATVEESEVRNPRGRGDDGSAPSNAKRQKME
ncbi:hypothetical protein RND81_07G114200 [Saponaria officinalis]|uniref:Ubiquitin-like domain-containing protein n=1 Tax=Saponaria officinalis TaxID=3572 RepID=A0AAW1JR35_SAPOF